MPRRSTINRSPDADGFALQTPAAAEQSRLPLAAPVPVEEKPSKRKHDSVRLVWDSKPKRPPSPRDIEFQIAEIVVPNPARDAGSLPFSMRDGVFDNEQVDKAKMNRLIWGDNLLTMQALLAQGYESSVDLIYIDPPFDSKADYSHRLFLEGTEVTKEPSVIERLAYSDTWQAGTDSYLDMLFPRLQLAKRLLADRGSIYVHIGPSIGPYVKALCDEVFGRFATSAEIVWRRVTTHGDSQHWGNVHDYILFYAKSADFTWNPQFRPYSEEYVQARYTNALPDGRRYTLDNLTSPHPRPNMTYKWRGHEPPRNGWRYSGNNGKASSGGQDRDVPKGRWTPSITALLGRRRWRTDRHGLG